ncbi:Hyaluronidase [Chionoecetes opilio]|uniref:Hyaluronidase n=1 Tax=Chionoecetes opilio TaxID=41210 RepID=A0A8J8WL21_CHIOP|nr:Hyaluronidase [Chionoecetes opilio]
MRACPWLCTWLWAWLSTWEGVTCTNSPFRVYWNVPSQHCAKFDVFINVSQYGLLQNAGDAFHGEKVTILYGPGAFPYLDTRGTPVNGGIPQNGSLATHVQLFINTLNNMVPQDFVGAAVLDFEDYYPSYDLSPASYRKTSRAWVKAQHPSWSPEEVEGYAADSFNASVRNYFQSLLWVGRELRPGGLWGYYHYPYCHNYAPGDGKCRDKTQAMNEEISWLFESSAAFYPSLYVHRDSGFDSRSRRQHIRTVLVEALRARRRVHSTAPVLPYVWSRYHDSPALLSPVDMVTTLGAARVLGAGGAVVWGASEDVATGEQCRNLKSFAESKLGPLVRYLAHLPRTKLNRLLASRRRVRRAVRGALRDATRTQAIRGAPVSVSNDRCANSVLEKCGVI